MSAIPKAVVPAAKDIQAALVVSPRERVPQVSRVRMAASGQGLARSVVVRGGGRRRGASERLVADVLDAGVSTVVVPSLAAFHPASSGALAIAGALLQAGVRVVSIREGAFSSTDGATIAAVASFLQEEERRRASLRGRRTIALVRQTRQRVGRPAKPLPVSAGQARDLIASVGWRAAAKRIGISAASMRRALAREGLLPVAESTGGAP